MGHYTSYFLKLSLNLKPLINLLDNIYIIYIIVGLKFFKEKMIKKLFFALLAVGMISSFLFRYSITSKYNGSDNVLHFRITCNNGHTDNIITLVSAGSIYQAQGMYTTLYKWGSNANQVFDQAVRDACGE